MIISLLHPSRSRPNKALETAREWYKCIGVGIGVEVEYIQSCDESDPCIEDYKYAFTTNPIVNNNTCVVEATNHAAKVSTGDILVYLSDDFKCPDYWANLLYQEFDGVNGPMLLKVDDCLQPFNTPVCTIPIMNRALYEKLGYFWHPEYKSMFVDEDLYWTAKKFGALKLAPHLKFPHEHYSNGKAVHDETYKKSEANWNQGKEVFVRRRALGFPV